METNIIYCEDCLDTMAKMEEKSVDLVVTSPPYNKSRQQSYSEKSLATRQGHYKDFNDARSNEEYIAWTLQRFAEFARVLKNDGVVCYNMGYGSDEIRTSELMWLVVAEVLKQGYFTLGDCIVWKKRNATPNNVSPNKLTRICEFVFIFCKRDSYDTYHCNKKVVGRNSKTGQNIYDNFYNIIDAENNDGPCDIHKATYSTNLCYQLLDRYAVKGGGSVRPLYGNRYYGCGRDRVRNELYRLGDIGGVCRVRE